MDIMIFNKLYEENRELRFELEKLKIQHAVDEDPYESPETKDINAALAKAQGEYPNIGNDGKNPFFKSSYATLDGIMRKIRPTCSKHGISLTQQVKLSPEGTTMLITRIWHTSGQWIESRCRMIPAKSDPQTFASMLTYYRRYMACALLGITTGDDDSDDDGEYATKEERKKFQEATAVNRDYHPKKEEYETIAKEQLQELEQELVQYPDIAEHVMDRLKIESLADLPKSKFFSVVNWIRETKQIRNTAKT